MKSNSDNKPAQNSEYLLFLNKIQTYCAYQERCKQDVVNKLTKLNAPVSSHNKIITQLVEDKFIDENRYALNFSRGKFINNKWGRIKIKYELIKKKIPSYIIDNALKSIKTEDYIKTITSIIINKSKSFSKPFDLKDRSKIINHVIAKGFEFDLVCSILDSL